MSTKNENLYRLPHTMPRKVGQTFTEPSKTVPNGSLSLKTLFLMQRNGQIVEPSLPTVDDPEFINYMCEMEDRDLTQLDAIRKRSSELYAKKEKQLNEHMKNISAKDVLPE